jgi:hypothetical protein
MDTGSLYMPQGKMSRRFQKGWDHPSGQAASGKDQKYPDRYRSIHAQDHPGHKGDQEAQEGPLFPKVNKHTYKQWSD